MGCSSPAAKDLISSGLLRMVSIAPVGSLDYRCNALALDSGDSG
jgi:hypothetical protein